MSALELHDREAERSLLGDLMNLHQRVADVAGVVMAADFYEPGHAAVYDAIIALHQAGHPCDPQSVRQQMGSDLKLIGGAQTLAEMVHASAGNPRRSAKTVRDWATTRRILNVCAEVRENLTHGVDPSAELDHAKALLASIDTPLSDVPRDLMSFDQLLDRPKEASAAWAVPGLLRVGWRAMVVAPEGIGKSVLFRQFAMLPAQGIHPLTFKPMEPIKTLLVDLENPPEAIDETGHLIRNRVRTVTKTYRDHQAWLWLRPGGINLRDRRDRVELESAIAEVRPQLVCIGPLYKAYKVSAKENDEQAAGEVQHVLDDLRTRYEFALLIEHHAPKAQGHTRDLQPYGSSFWLRWPEFGFKLLPPNDEPNPPSLDVKRWRGDRLKAAWPDRLDRGNGAGFPWSGWWPHGF